ncbi:hypothetical protein ACFL6C_01320 [Myxococcota bacterium]
MRTVRVIATWLIACWVASACDCGSNLAIETALCGNGRIQEAEACDDGDEIDNGEGGCLADCSGVQTCGDGDIEGTELCDERDGNTDDWTPNPRCNATCTGYAPYCGDDITNGPEACDDGLVNGTYDQCKEDCSGMGPHCGDGVVDTDHEACEPGLGDPCDGCVLDCSGLAGEAVCGDGVVCAGVETCDDGYLDACGSCNATCTAAGSASTCGDGDACPETEVCDDGFADACGTCNEDCSAEGTGPGVCGDGSLCPEYEACDDGFTDACGSCNADCTAAGEGSTCSDGDICAETETCDDGFADACGSCNANCTSTGDGATCGDGEVCPELEVCDDGADNGTISASQPFCRPDCQGTQLCGNGMLEGTETCDDGNNDDCVGACLADCSGTIVITGCGDGVNCPPEECDAGQNGDPCDGCLDDCTVPNPPPGPTTAPAVIDEDTVWYAVQSPMRLDSSFAILEGQRLVVCAGVRVEATAGAGVLVTVRGELESRGVESAPVVFTSDSSSPATGDWDGIRIFDDEYGGVSARAWLYATIVEFASNGIVFDCVDGDGIVAVERSTFRNNDVAFSTCEGVNLDTLVVLDVDQSNVIENRIGVSGAQHSVFTDCVFSGNEYGAFGAPFLELIGCDITGNTVGVQGQWHLGDVVSLRVEGCLLADNDYAGVRLFDEQYEISGNTLVRNGVGLIASMEGPTDPLSTVENNIFCDNTNFDVDVGVAYSMSATNNWWCTTDPDVIATRIWDVYDDSSLGQVTFEPFLTEAPPDAPEP